MPRIPKPKKTRATRTAQRKKPSPASTPATPAANSSAGAATALAGYDYQLDVSIFAALRLLLITNSASRITLEPANEEDLEADLKPAQPGRVMPVGVLTTGYKLVVQIKLRRGEPWAIEDFDALLNHGEKRRPAKHHLDDPNTRYLLVTNADAKGVARGLLVSDFEEQADATGFPASLKKTLAHKPEGRVAIWGGLSERLMAFEIRHILGELLRVPQQRQGECQNALRTEAKKRMRGTNPGVWTREDLLETIRSHGGYLASAADLEAFVPPSNFDVMVSSLENDNAIIITGSSGTGKTWAALALCNEARKRNGKLNVVVVSPESGPATVRRAATIGPTLFYIEDPWGQYSLQHGSESWTTQLPRLLGQARPDLQYVITSRSDMVHYARADEGLTRWSTELNAEHYKDGGLDQIYDKRMSSLPARLETTALTFRDSILEALKTPLELDLFFRNLAEGPHQGESEGEFLARLRRHAHRNAVENVVVRYLHSLGDVGIPAVIWGLLRARTQVTRAQLVSVQGATGRVDPAMSDRLGKAIDRLIVTRHLRQPAQTVAFAHPSVRAGFEQFMRENPACSLASLKLLVGSLVSAGDRQWGVETAARVLDAAGRLPGGEHWQLTIHHADQAAIDRWLQEAMLDPGTRLGPLLQLAANVGSLSSKPSDLARWLLYRVQTDPFDEGNHPADMDEAWYDSMRSDPRSAMIVNRYVREQLPHEHGQFVQDPVKLLERIAGDLTTTCLATVDALVNAGYEPSFEPVVTGAARAIEAYEAILDKALDVLHTARSGDTQARETRRAIEDGEHDESYAEYFEATDYDDDGYCAQIIVDTYVTTQRSAGRWQALAGHRLAPELVRFWARDIAHGEVPTNLEEMGAALRAASSTPDEDIVWDAARSNWRPELEPLLITRMSTEPDDGRLRLALAQCALEAAPAVLVAHCKSSHAALVNLLVDIQTLRSRDTALANWETVLAALPDTAQQIWQCIAASDKQSHSLSGEPLQVLEAVAAGAPLRVLAEVVPLLIASGHTGADAVRALMATDKADEAAVAAQAAVALENDELMSLALDHCRAKARAIALMQLGMTSPLPLPNRLLALARDRSSLVRQALVNLLYRRKSEQHVPTITLLVKDTWSDAALEHDAPESYPIARKAVDALICYGPLEDRVGSELIAVAQRTADKKLCWKALSAAATYCGPTVRKAVWAMVEDNNGSGANYWLRTNKLS